MSGARPLVLTDGSTVLVREIERGDVAALKRLVGRLSERSRYFRFFGAQRELSDEQARRFTEVDGVWQYALVAVSPEDGEILAVVRYEAEDASGDSAEYAALVEDRMQRKGLGMALTRHLVEAARERGIRRLEAYVLLENTGMLHLLANLGLPTTRTVEDGVNYIEVDLGPRRAA